MHRLSDAEDSGTGDVLSARPSSRPVRAPANPKPICGQNRVEAARPRTSPDRITELRKWPARHSERGLPRLAFDLKMLTERAAPSSPLPPLLGGMGRIRGHRLTLRSTVALSHLHRGAAPPATRGHLTVIVARDRRQPPLATATSPGTSRPHVRRTLHRRAGTAITGIPCTCANRRPAVSKLPLDRARSFALPSYPH
jgi:hypothetical protein